MDTPRRPWLERINRPSHMVISYIHPTAWYAWWSRFTQKCAHMRVEFMLHYTTLSNFYFFNRKSRYMWTERRCSEDGEKIPSAKKEVAVSDLAVDMRIGRLMMSRTRDRHSSSIPCSLFSLLAYNIYTPAPPYVSHYPSPRSSLYIFPYFIFDISFVLYISLAFQTEQSTQITFLPQVSIFDQIQNVCTYHNSQWWCQDPQNWVWSWWVLLGSWHKGYHKVHHLLTSHCLSLLRRHHPLRQGMRWASRLSLEDRVHLHWLCSNVQKQ